MKQEKTLEKIHQEVVKFKKMLEELDLMKNVSQDLKSYKKMLKLKKYD